MFVTSEKKEAKDDGGGGEASKSKEGKDGSEERELTGSKVGVFRLQYTLAFTYGCPSHYIFL